MSWWSLLLVALASIADVVLLRWFYLNRNRERV